jgi:hypothetical protein
MGMLLQARQMAGDGLRVAAEDDRRVLTLEARADDFLVEAIVRLF